MKFVSKGSSNLKWLYLGMHVKRWLLLLTMGIAIIGLGLSYLLKNIYYTWAFPAAFYYLTLQFVPRMIRALLFGVLGISIVALAVVKLNQSILDAFRSPGESSLVDVVYQHWYRSRGPKVVAIGGGTGLSTLLRGLKVHTSNITAIVSVADDGGSSGRLRRELGVLPPGDIRNCIAALADAESLTTKLFQHRFGEESELDGHSFGNLFIVAMAGVTGNFERAVLESSRVLAVKGSVLPSTLSNVTLWAEVLDEGEGTRVEGESRIPKPGRVVERVFLEPTEVPPCPEAVRALMEADLILAGPGSLYTSILPNLVIDGIAEALHASPAPKLYICNVATQLGETEHYSVDDHVRALERHVGEGSFEYVLANDNFEAGFPLSWTVQLVPLDEAAGGRYELITQDVIDRENLWRHDPKKLAQALMDFYHSH